MIKKDKENKKEPLPFGAPRFSDNVPEEYATKLGFRKGQYFIEEDFIPPLKPYNLRLKEIRNSLKLNQTEAGQIMMTTQKQYSRWETGNYEVPLFELSLFALWTNLKMDYILGLSDDSSPLFSEEDRIKRIKALRISSFFNQHNWYDWWGNEDSKIHENKAKK